MDKAYKKENGAFKYHMADVSSLPKDVVLGVPIVTIIGEYEVYIENYRGIIEYTDALIRIKVKDGQIKITGKRLQIGYYTNEDMQINGKIERIEYKR